MMGSDSAATTTVLAALVGVLATLGAVGLGAWLARRTEQQQWLRNECKRVYLEFLADAYEFETALEAYYKSATSDPLFWEDTNSGTASVRWRMSPLDTAKSKLDRARDETRIFGDERVDAAQQLLYTTIFQGYNAVSTDERTAKMGLPAVQRCLDDLDDVTTRYQNAVRKSFGR